MRQVPRGAGAFGVDAFGVDAFEVDASGVDAHQPGAFAPVTPTRAPARSPPQCGALPRLNPRGARLPEHSIQIGGDAHTGLGQAGIDHLSLPIGVFP